MDKPWREEMSKEELLERMKDEFKATLPESFRGNVDVTIEQAEECEGAVRGAVNLQYSVYVRQGCDKPLEYKLMEARLLAMSLCEHLAAMLDA